VALTATFAAATTALAACGDDEPDALPTTERTSTPTAAPATPTATAPATPTAEPTESATLRPPRRPQSKNTPKGRKDFAVFVIERWGYALATNNATAVAALAPKGTTCQGCRQLRAELAKRKERGWFVDFPGADVKRVKVVPGDTPGVWVATARISVPASRSYFEDGTYRNDNDAHPNVDFTVRMRHQAGRFVLLAFTID
jgi:hypothetical protein